MNIVVRALSASLLVWLVQADVSSSQVLVLSSRGPSSSAYIAGEVIGPDKTIVLRTGDRLEVLFADHSTVLMGPNTFRAGQIDTTSRLTLQSILRRVPQRTDIAAVRGAQVLGDPPSIWRLSVAPEPDANPPPRSQDSFCVVGDESPTLARSSARQEGRLEIRDNSTQSTAVATWPIGQLVMTWPADVPALDGVRYSLSLDSQPATTVTLRRLTSPPTDLRALASTLLDRGCYQQLVFIGSQTVRTP